MLASLRPCVLNTQTHIRLLFAILKSTVSTIRINWKLMRMEIIDTIELRRDCDLSARSKRFNDFIDRYSILAHLHPNNIDVLTMNYEHHEESKLHRRVWVKQKKRFTIINTRTSFKTPNAFQKFRYVRTFIYVCAVRACKWYFVAVLNPKYSAQWSVKWIETNFSLSRNVGIIIHIYNIHSRVTLLEFNDKFN